MVFRLWF